MAVRRKCKSTRNPYVESIYAKEMRELANEQINRGKDYVESEDETFGEFGLKELDYIKFLDIQEYSQVKGEIDKLVTLAEDIALHYNRLCEVTDEILDDMEKESKKTPCDYPDNYGHYSCPYDAETSVD